MTRYQITVRHGAPRHRYHTLRISGDDVRDALRATADRLSDDIAAGADLVEVREAVDPDERSFLGEST